MDSKSCSRCQCVKPLEDFHKNASSPDGRYSICRQCSNKTSRIKRSSAEAKEQEKERSARYYQENKDRLLENRKKRYERDKEKALESNRKWHEANIEHHRELNRQWSKNNPEAARALVARRRARLLEADGFYTKDDIFRMIDEQGGLCPACNADLANGYNVDHVIPVSRGGSNYPDNLQLLCPTCNRSKSNKLPHEWRPNGY